MTVDFRNSNTRALDGVSLSVGAGEQLALLGPSGSGKTTLMRLMLGAVTPSAGTADMGGLDPFGSAAEVRRLRRRTGCVRQRDDLVAGITGRANALMGTASDWKAADWAAFLCGRTPQRYTAALTALARHHDIESCLWSRIEHLSGGQRQRVALVRALLPQPELLLADEPTSGLDPLNAERVVDGLLGAQARTVVVATHDLTVAKRLERVVALREGRIVYDGPSPDEGVLAGIYGVAAEEATFA